MTLKNLTGVTLAVVLLAFTCPQVALAQDAAKKAKAPKVTIKKDIVYAQSGGQDLHLDLAQPAGDGPFPAIVCIHGGSWRQGTKEQFGPLPKRLAQKGYVVISIQYRLAPKHTFPAQIEDCKCAVRWLRGKAKELKVDSKRIGAIGFSAGAHLALLLGLMDSDDGLEGQGGHQKQSSKVQAVVNFFGPTDIRAFPEHRLITEFMGGTKTQKAELYKKASPTHYIDKDDAPILTLHGTRDFIVPYSQAQALTKKLKAAGVETKLHTVKDAGHGWGGKKFSKSWTLAEEFFAKHLGNASSKSASPKKAPKEAPKKRAKLY